MPEYKRNITRKTVGNLTSTLVAAIQDLRGKLIYQKESLIKFNPLDSYLFQNPGMRSTMIVNISRRPRSIQKINIHLPRKGTPE
jgi:hypothetical protein